MLILINNKLEINENNNKLKLRTKVSQEESKSSNLMQISKNKKKI